MDGIAVNEGVVFVFTTNCSLDLIDRAFKRPGRMDVVLHFKAPDATLRRQLIERHGDSEDASLMTMKRFVPGDLRKEIDRVFADVPPSLAGGS